MEHFPKFVNIYSRKLFNEVFEENSTLVYDISKEDLYELYYNLRFKTNFPDTFVEQIFFLSYGFLLVKLVDVDDRYFIDRYNEFKTQLDLSKDPRINDQPLTKYYYIVMETLNALINRNEVFTKTLEESILGSYTPFGFLESYRSEINSPCDVFQGIIISRLMGIIVRIFVKSGISADDYGRSMSEVLGFLRLISKYHCKIEMAHLLDLLLILYLHSISKSFMYHNVDPRSFKENYDDEQKWGSTTLPASDSLLQWIRDELQSLLDGLNTRCVVLKKYYS